VSAVTLEAEAQLDVPAPSPARPRRRWRQPRYYVTIALFLAPSALPLIALVYYPMVQALWTSLHDWNLIGPKKWVGLGNYEALFKDPGTASIFAHSAQYIAGYIPLVYVGGLAVALALNTALKGRNFFRGIYFLPVVTSWIAVSLVWRWLLNPHSGAVNALLGWFGITGPGWYNDPHWAMPSIIVASVWKDVGFIMVILLAGLQAIPAEIEEAAVLDGAGWWRRLFHVTLPLLSPTTFFVLIISLIGGFQVFDQAYAMTQGGPNDATRTVVLQIYDLTFRYGQAGMASALSMLLFVVILTFTAIQLVGQRRWVHYA
jgi:multiple sugar transport system permease protein